MRTRKAISLTLAVGLFLLPFTCYGQSSDTANEDVIGQSITTQNWQQFRQYMPDGLVALFEGKYFWKMPDDVSIEIGPTVSHEIPIGYRNATEKYSSQVKIIALPDQGLTLQNYVGGQPFQHPTDPHKGWKILANLWYRYVPSLMVENYGKACGLDSSRNISCSAYQFVYRQLAYNTDRGVPSRIPGTGDKFRTVWVMFLEPEQQRYLTSLKITYKDLSRPEEVFVFLPSLRRYQPLATQGRCASQQGFDATADDYNYGFDENLTEVQVDYIGERKIVSLLDAKFPTEQFPSGFILPLGWPTKGWGKWQLRDVDVIAVSKLPSRSADYCYGRRVMYIDKRLSALLWEDLYDRKMQPWKFVAGFLRTADVPGTGPLNISVSGTEVFWDIQKKHATFTADPADEQPLLINDQVPQQFKDLVRYTEPTGLNLIMR